MPLLAGAAVSAKLHRLLEAMGRAKSNICLEIEAAIAGLRKREHVVPHTHPLHQVIFCHLPGRPTLSSRPASCISAAMSVKKASSNQHMQSSKKVIVKGLGTLNIGGV
eukprot:5148866-Pleurochrysis_carterae.AAC.2